LLFIGMGPRGKESGHTGLPGSGDFGFIGAALLAKLTPKDKKSVIARSVLEDDCEGRMRKPLAWQKMKED